MHQGSHFGKNKPEWNSTQPSMQALKIKYHLKLKLLIMGVISQGFILFPIVYWSIQNYIFFENNIPANYNLKNYINTEKQWMIFIYATSVIFSAFFNLYLISRINQRPSDHETSLDEAADQRRAS
jgi:hypothetical protein